MQRHSVMQQMAVILFVAGLVTAVGGSMRVAHAQQRDGKTVYATTCAACHQLTGLGSEGQFPPLAGSEWVNEDGKLLRIILHGLSGPVQVAGKAYDGAMPGWGAILTNAEVAAVATYVRSSWGNKAKPLTAAKVASVRKSTKRTTPWTAAELAKVIQVRYR